MPEYLSPGVYVEEVSTGTRPIEGVSTSTSGLIGVTERGPEDVPVLVTSIGEFRRVYGDHLDFQEVTDSNGNIYGYLPHAVDGYFPNGGRRAYIVRVLPDDAEHARRFLYDREEAGDADTVLLRAAPGGSGTVANLPRLYALEPGPLAGGDTIRVGDGSRAEYREIAGGGISVAERHLALNFPLGAAFNSVASVEEMAFPPSPDVVTYPNGSSGSPAVFDLEEDTEVGDDQILVDGDVDRAALLDLATGSGFFQVGGDENTAEFARITGAEPAGGNLVRLTLASSLAMPYAGGDTITAINLTAPTASNNLDIDASAGDMLIYCDPTGFNPNQLVIIDQAGASPEIRRIAQLSNLTFDVGAYRNYPYGSIVQLMNMADDDRVVGVVAGLVVPLDRVDGLVPGMTISFDNDLTNAAIIATVDEGASAIILQAAPPSGIVGPGSPAAPQAKALTRVSRASGISLSLSNRLGLAQGDVLRVGLLPNEEYVTIAEVSGPRGIGSDPGVVLLSAPLSEGYAAGTEVRRQHPPTIESSRQPCLLVLAASQAGTEVAVNDGNNANPGARYTNGDVVRVRVPSGAFLYHRLSANSASYSPREIELAGEVSSSYEGGMPLVERRQLVRIRALDRGQYGNRLFVSIEDEETGLVSGTTLESVAAPFEIRLSTVTGVEPGTIFELRDPDTDARIGDPLKVRSVDRAANNLVVLDPPGISPLQDGAHITAVGMNTRLQVVSREFSLTTWILERPHPAIPSRANQVRDSEFFRNLSLDHRHSRYMHRVIGTTWTAGNDEDDDGIPLRLWDRRSEGESSYIRVQDLANNDAEREAARPGPEALTDTLPSGLEQPARHPLSLGSNSAASMGDAMYEGQDDDEPLERTGIFAFNNIPEISLIAAPGVVTAAVQQALVDHCEADSYRFAILDAQGPNRDSLADVQNQRQQFDTTYAGLYHPWLTIPEPMPQNLSNIRQLPIAPSGHVAGVFARTDNERGVHKAPANEVVRGITGLQRSLNKGEHDILNPFPRNINVIRDFREENRGIRIWGARNITSDSDYKYTNVRRLMIFIRASLDRGLPWVVFEPNSEITWARVRRAITNFLTVVHRNGALEGTTIEEAFFVKCDRTTMTQQDLDNGRLIAVVGVAPVKPAEFVIVRIGLWTANAQQ